MYNGVLKFLSEEFVDDIEYVEYGKDGRVNPIVNISIKAYGKFQEYEPGKEYNNFIDGTSSIDPPNNFGKQFRIVRDSHIKGIGTYKSSQFNRSIIDLGKGGYIEDCAFINTSIIFKSDDIIIRDSEFKNVTIKDLTFNIGQCDMSNVTLNIGSVVNDDLHGCILHPDVHLVINSYEELLIAMADNIAPDFVDGNMSLYKVDNEITAKAICDKHGTDIEVSYDIFENETACLVIAKNTHETYNAFVIHSFSDVFDITKQVMHPAEFTKKDVASILNCMLYAAKRLDNDAFIKSIMK